MKHSAALSLVVTLLATSPVIAHAQSGGMKGMEMKGDMKGMDMKGMDMGSKDSTSKGSTHKANGVVKAVDVQKSTVTLAHGPVSTMKWPAMQMTFKVRDKAMLDKLAVDKKVDVEFVAEGKDYVVTSVK